jgi:hypothetical protein
VDLLEEVPVPVEECAVDAGVPGDAADGDFLAAAGRVPECLERVRGGGRCRLVGRLP